MNVLWNSAILEGPRALVQVSYHDGVHTSHLQPGVPLGGAGTHAPQPDRSGSFPRIALRCREKSMRAPGKPEEKS